MKVEKGKMRKFDEKKFANVSTVEEVTIYSEFVDIEIVASSDHQLEVRLQGSAKCDEKIDIVVQEVDVEKKKLQIRLEPKGNFYKGNLTCWIFIPQNSVKKISVDTVSAEVNLREDLCIERFVAHTKSGNVDCCMAQFARANITTESGSVDILFEATGNVTTEITTVSGNARITLWNVGEVNLLTKRCGTNYFDKCKFAKGYMADLMFYTQSGSINVIPH